MDGKFSNLTIFIAKSVILGKNNNIPFKNPSAENKLASPEKLASKVISQNYAPLWGYTFIP